MCLLCPIAMCALCGGPPPNISINRRDPAYAPNHTTYEHRTALPKTRTDGAPATIKISQLPAGLKPHHRQSVTTGNVQQMFSKSTKAIVWGMQTRAVQSMLDFDFICR